MHEQTPMHIIFAGGFVFKNGALLLGKRDMSEGHLPGHWAVPGGKVEIHANTIWNVVEHTVANEVREETGIEVDQSMQLLNTNNFTRTDGKPVVAMNFVCSYKSGTAQALDGTSDVVWAQEPNLTNLKIEENTLKQIKMAFALNKKSQAPQA